MKSKNGGKEGREQKGIKIIKREKCSNSKDSTSPYFFKEDQTLKSHREDFIKLKSFCSVKVDVNLQTRKKIFANHTNNKGLLI